ncbi:MAG: effector binding domain-containing protein [Rothia sp. (in: high G+C Gram-positive bacteria)]|nr:effector binding domain-containing protein [Rothia sp. (in: high G+C Gram-positive bacteria)]
MIGARIEHKDEFFIAGFRETVKQGAGIGELWKKLTTQAEARGVTMSEVHPVGVIVGMNAAGEFDYMAGFLVENLETAQALGFNALKVDGGEFAVTQVEGPVPMSTMAGVDHLMGTFLPASGFKPKGPVFEAYGPGDPSADDFQMQVWVPVKPA